MTFLSESAESPYLTFNVAFWGPIVNLCSEDGLTSEEAIKRSKFSGPFFLILECIGQAYQTSQNKPGIQNGDVEGIDKILNDFNLGIRDRFAEIVICCVPFNVLPNRQAFRRLERVDMILELSLRKSVLRFLPEGNTEFQRLRAFSALAELLTTLWNLSASTRGMIFMNPKLLKLTRLLKTYLV